MAHEWMVPTETRKDAGSSGPGVTGDCELLCGYREANIGLLQEQQVLLTTDSSLKPQIYNFYIVHCFTVKETGAWRG